MKKIFCLMILAALLCAALTGACASAAAPDQSPADLAPESAEPEKLPEVMARLTGAWMLESGGALAGEYLVLGGDGAFAAAMWNWDADAPEEPYLSGTWYVTDCGPSAGPYWNDTPCELSLLCADGQVKTLGLDFNDSGFSLTDEEGLGAYIPEAEESAD